MVIKRNDEQLGRLQTTAGPGTCLIAPRPGGLHDAWNLLLALTPHTCEH